MGKDWEKVAKEYRKEIDNLWNDMYDAIYNSGKIRRTEILKKSLESSEKVVFEIEKFN